MSQPLLSPKRPSQMLEDARELLAQGRDPRHLLKVAIAQRDRWAEKVEREDAGELMDGRASIYTGETYAEARDRWEAYRVLLLEEIGGLNGGGC